MCPPGISSGCFLRAFSPGVSSGYFLRLFPPRVSSGCFLWVFSPGVSSGCFLRVFPPGVFFGYFLRVFPPGVSSGCFLRIFPPVFLRFPLDDPPQTAPPAPQHSSFCFQISMNFPALIHQRPHQKSWTNPYGATNRLPEVFLLSATLVRRDPRGSVDG